MNSLSAPKESRADKLIRTGLKNPFEVRYERFLKTQIEENGHDQKIKSELHDDGHDELLQYHDPDHGSDTDFEEPDMDLIEDHVKNKPKIEDSDSDGENDVKPTLHLSNNDVKEPILKSNKRRKIDTVAKDDGDPQVYQMRVALIEPNNSETKCIKGNVRYDC